MLQKTCGGGEMLHEVEHRYCKLDASGTQKVVLYDGRDDKEPVSVAFRDAEWRQWVRHSDGVLSYRSAPRQNDPPDPRIQVYV